MNIVMTMTTTLSITFNQKLELIIYNSVKLICKKTVKINSCIQGFMKSLVLKFKILNANFRERTENC
jgi:hypothetical protein